MNLMYDFEDGEERVAIIFEIEYSREISVLRDPLIGLLENGLWLCNYRKMKNCKII